MAEIFIVFSGIMGAAVGSFLSVAAARLPRGEGIIWRRSRCPRCAATLGPFELIPLVSFLAQRGRCRHCRLRLSLQYPFLELATAALFLLSAYVCRTAVGACFGVFPLVLWWFFLSVLLLIAVIDYRHLVVPEGVVAGAFLVALIARGIFAPATLVNALMAAALGGGLFWLLVLVSHERWMGMGDAYVGALLGIVLGWPVLGAALIGASLLGGLCGAGLLLSNRKRLGDELPFAPFLVAGGMLAFFGMPLAADLASGSLSLLWHALFLFSN